jgi:hypothetical protein
MPAPQRIWRSKLWAKHGETRVIIHVIADVDSVGFRVVAVPKSGKAAVIGSGAAPTVFAARIAAESLAARVSPMASHRADH